MMAVGGAGADGDDAVNANMGKRSMARKNMEKESILAAAPAVMLALILIRTPPCGLQPSRSSCSSLLCTSSHEDVFYGHMLSKKCAFLCNR
ncbi:hypothetical protein DKP78_17215 [Enterococcus faecium]|nr:hypothetical protein DKP78_17215 [Enterococcus faecium]